MTVKLQVTPAQGLALQAMFEHWNRLTSMGASRFSAFYVDGDGNFKPKCSISYSAPLPDLTPELREKASTLLGDVVASAKDEYSRAFDFDSIAWALNK